MKFNQNFEIIHKLEKDSFFLFGGIYLYKRIKNKDERDEQKQLDDIYKSASYKNAPPLRSLNYGEYSQHSLRNLKSINDSDTGSRAVLKKKVHNLYTELLNDDVDGYDKETIEIQKNKLLNETISGDEYIIIPRAGFVGNNLADIEKSSLIVLKLSDEINMGFIVDKAAIEIMGFNKTTKEENNA